MRKPKEPEIDPFTIVVVDWIDAYGGTNLTADSPVAAAEAYQPCIRRTVGYYMYKNKDVVCVGGDDDRTSSSPHACSNLSYVPVSLVRSIKPVAKTKLTFQK